MLLINGARIKYRIACTCNMNQLSVSSLDMICMFCLSCSFMVEHLQCSIKFMIVDVCTLSRRAQV
jgi:hypothetical protein